MDEAARDDIEQLMAESLALQSLFVCLMNRIKRLDPALAGVPAEVFDEAANVIENLALGRAKTVRHLPDAIKVVEDLRKGVCGPTEPKQAI
jgi:hypothetical protein